MQIVIVFRFQNTGEFKHYQLLKQHSVPWAQQVLPAHSTVIIALRVCTKTIKLLSWQNTSPVT